jgi:predicted transposase YbfD/YdcC
MKKTTQERKIKIETLKRKIEKQLRDPRRQYGHILHKLWEMVVIALCSVLCLGEDYDDMEEFGKEREKWLREELGLELQNGIPSGDTFRRLFERLNPKEFRSCLEESIGYVRSSREIVNIDGKTKRGSGIHILNAFVGEHQITLGEIKSESKRGEIKEIPKLLDLIDVKGHIVTIDSIGCQREIVAKLSSKEIGADYCIGLKKNQRNLYNAVSAHFTEGVRVFESESTAEYGHGRMEIRHYYLETDTSWLEQAGAWAGLKSVGMATSCVYRNGKSTCSTRYYITSLTDVDEFAYAVREHWAIENKLHWSLDVILREDSDIVKKDNAPLNLNILDKFALQLVSHADLGKLTRKRKRYKAALNPDVLLSMILCQ